jgi:chromosome segregation ATPase
MAVFAKRVTAPTAVSVPSLEEASPEYAALVTKRGQLEARRAEIDRETEKLRKGTAPAALAAARTERARALLGDIADGATILTPTREDIGRRIADLNRERSDIEGALAMLSTRIERATNEASRAACDQIREGYAAAVVAVAVQLARARKAYGELIRITEELEVNEVRWLGNLPQPTNLNLFLGNRYRDVNLSAAERFIADAITAGLVTPAELEKANG